MNHDSKPGKTFGDIHNKKNEVLDEVLDVERKLASGEVKRGKLTSWRRKGNKLKKKYKSLGGNYDWKKYKATNRRKQCFIYARKKWKTAKKKKKKKMIKTNSM